MAPEAAGWAATLAAGLGPALALAQWPGYAAFAFGLACFAQTDDRRFKVFMALECAAYALHFALLGEATAVASTLLSLGRSLAALHAPVAWRPAVGLGFIGLNLLAGAWLFDGARSLLPIAASVIGTTALFFLHGVAMRSLMLVGTALWLVNNLIVGSVGGSLLEACLLLANARTIGRMRRQAAGRSLRS